MYLYVCIDACACMCTCVQGSEVEIRCLPQLCFTFIFETPSLIEPGTCLFCYPGWQGGESQYLSISASQLWH